MRTAGAKAGSDDLPLIPDGGTEDRPPGYGELHEQGVPEATIEKWNTKGYDLRWMSDALEQYRGSGETLTSDEPAGELAEILAKSEVKQIFSSNIRLKSNIKLDSGNAGEFDYVVLNQDGEVIGVVEVKHVDDKTSLAKRQLKDAMKALNYGDIDSVSGTLTTEDFHVSHDIKRITIGPSSDKQRVEESDIPEHSLIKYSKHIELEQDAIKTLAKLIINR